MDEKEKMKRLPLFSLNAGTSLIDFNRGDDYLWIEREWDLLRSP